MRFSNTLPYTNCSRRARGFCVTGPIKTERKRPAQPQPSPYRMGGCEKIRVLFTVRIKADEWGQANQNEKNIPYSLAPIRLPQSFGLPQPSIRCIGKGRDTGESKLCRVGADNRPMLP